MSLETLKDSPTVVARSSWPLEAVLVAGDCCGAAVEQSAGFPKYHTFQHGESTYPLNA